MKQLLCLVPVVAVIGCASAKVTMFGTFSYAPTTSVDVYHTTKPERSYVELAQISCGDTDDDWNLNQIKAKAMAIGADAIIIVGKSGSTAGAVPIGKTFYAFSQEYGLVAIAVKYK